MEPATIYLPPRLELEIDLTDEQFWQLCQKNDNLRFERSAEGELIIMSPTGDQPRYFRFHLAIILPSPNP